MMRSKSFISIFGCVLVLLMACGINASAIDNKKVSVNGICYEFNRKAKTAIVVGGVPNTGRDGEMVIPAYVTYKGKKYKVNEIADGAFARCYDIFSIIIEGHLRSIGNLAFDHCGALSRFIYDGADDIAPDAFRSTPANLEVWGLNYLRS